MHRVFGLRPGSNFRVRLPADKKFYLWLTVEKMHALTVFMKNYLRSYGCSDTNFMATVKCTNQEIETQIETIETLIIGIQIYFVIKNIILLFKTCFFAVN